MQGFVSMFWNAQGIIPTDYLQNKKSISEVYYINLILKLREVLKEKRQRKWRSGFELNRLRSQRLPAVSKIKRTFIYVKKTIKKLTRRDVHCRAVAIFIQEALLLQHR